MKEAQALITEATALTVQTVSSRQRAADLFDAIRSFRKQSEAQREEVVRPLKTAYDGAKKPFDEFEKECKGHEARLQTKMGEWDREQDRIATVEQQRLQALTDKANAKIALAAEKRGVEPAFKLPPVVAMAPKSIVTQAGTTSTRQVRIVYGIAGVAAEKRLTPEDNEAKALFDKYPGLFVMDWVAFRKLAATGMLDSLGCVEKKEEYSYVQRGTANV